MEKSTTLFEKFRETGKHGIIYGIGSILQKVISFALLPLYTTRFAASDYGILGLVTITGTVISMIFTVGLNVGLIRSYYDYKDEENRKSVLSTAFYLALISSLMLLIFGLVFSKDLSLLLFKSTNYRIHFIIIIVTSVFDILNIIPFVIFRVKMKSVQFVIFQTAFLLLGIGLIVYLVNYAKLGILGSLIGNLAVSALTFFVFYIYFRKEINFKFLKIEFKKMLLIGLPLIPSDISVFVFTAIDRYFLNYYSTTRELGLYNLAYNFGNIITVLLATPVSLIWPTMYLSAKDHDNAKEFYSRALTYTLCISLFLFLVFGLLAREVLHIMSNKEYWDSYMVIPIIVMTYSLWSLRKIINVAVTLTRKVQGLAIINFIGAAINIGLNFLLIPKYGMMGAGFATLITYIIVIVSMFFYNQRLMKLYYEWQRIIKILIVTTAIFALGYFIVINNLVFAILFKVLIILSYPFLLYFLRFFKEGEILRLKELYKSFILKIRKRKNRA